MWLARLEDALAVGMPREVEARLLRLGLAHLAEVGLKVSAEGEALLKNRLGKTRARATATRRWTTDLIGRVEFEHERAKKLVEDAKSLRAPRTSDAKATD
jgi:hypothetical protein